MSDEESGENDKSSKGPRWRRVLAVILVIVGTLSLLGANLMLYVRRTMAETNSFVDTLAPLSSDTDVTTALAERLTLVISDAIGVEDLVADGLPEDLSFIAGPITTSVEGFVADEVEKVLNSEAFSTIWRGSLAVVHEQVKAALNDDKEFLKTNDGKVVLDLTSVVDKVSQKLSDAGLELPDSAQGTVQDKLDNVGEITLYSSDQLRELQNTIDLLNKLAQVLYVLTLVAFVGAVVAAVRRRPIIMAIGASSVVVMILTLLALAIARSFIVDSVNADLQQTAVGSVFDTIVRGLLTQIYVLFFVGLALFVGGLVMGPYRWATWLRGRVTSHLESVRAGRHRSKGVLGRLRVSFLRHRSYWFGGGIIVSLVVLILWPRPTLAVLAVTALVLAVYLVLVEIYAQTEIFQDTPDSPDEGVDAATLET